MASTNKNLTTASTNEEPMVEVSLENSVSDIGESESDEKLDNDDLPTLSVEMDKGQTDAKTDGKEALDTPDIHLERRHQFGNDKKKAKDKLNFTPFAPVKPHTAQPGALKLDVTKKPGENRVHTPQIIIPESYEEGRDTGKAHRWCDHLSFVCAAICVKMTKCGLKVCGC